MESNNTISLCMIVKNEEEVLERCLNSVKKLVDEIIIVDTGSIDNTKKIAQKFTNNIYDFVWINDFSAARNFAFSKATKKYIMWLDADDVLPIKTLNILLKLKENLCSDTYMVKYQIPINEKNNFYFYRERILKNTPKAYWQGAVHECIVPFGKIEFVKEPIIHKKEKNSDPKRNLKLYKYTLKQRALSPRETYYYGRELYDNAQYKQAINVLKKFLQKPTCTENLIDALLIISNCYEKLGERQHQISYLTKILEIDVPNANVCCKMGDYFLTIKNYNVADFWYKQAIKSKKQESLIGFINDVYYNYYPYLQLCVLNYYLGDYKKSLEYNNKAGLFLESEAVKENRKLLNRLLKNKT